jgi:predicted O-methyltransferase YrrM
MTPLQIIDYVKCLDTKQYSRENDLSRLFTEQQDNNYDATNEWSTSSRAGGEAFPPDYDDLARLHALVTKRKIINILELGSGKSTIVFADALKKNHDLFRNELNGIRRSNPFRLLSIESEEKYITEVQNECEKRGLGNYVKIVLSEAMQTTYSEQICGQYKNIPPCCPDLIYLDGPMPMSYSNGGSEYMDMRHKEVTNITCDVLRIEPILLPGTIIIIDGTTNNSRFIRNNMKRCWESFEDTNADYTIMILDEEPLGIIHKRQLKFQNS